MLQPGSKALPRMMARLAALAPPPGPKPPNKGRGHSFMDASSAPTKSGNGRLPHSEALGFYFGPPVLTQSDTRSAHRSNWPPLEVVVKIASSRFSAAT